MEALRFIKKIEGDNITLDNLSKFKGKECEIIVMPFVDNSKLNTDFTLPQHSCGRIKKRLNREEIYNNER